MLYSRALNGRNPVSAFRAQKGVFCFEEAYATKKLVPHAAAHVFHKHLQPPHLYPHRAHSDEDNVQTIFLFISPLPPQASGATPPVGSDEEAAGGSAFLTHHATNGIKICQGLV